VPAGLVGRAPAVSRRGLPPGHGDGVWEPGFNTSSLVSPTDDFVAHSAMVAPGYDAISITCPAEPTYFPESGMFSVECSATRTGAQNISSRHETSVSDCVDTCSTHLDDGCVGVLYQLSLAQGYDNCYLLNDTGEPVPGGANATFAHLTQSRALTPDADDSSRGHSSKAWIAGPVIGALLAILPIIGAVY